MARLRISAISYLNTAPLMWDFVHGGAREMFEVSYTLPAKCAAELRDGTADIGIIPAAAYATIPDLLLLPDVAIASRGPVKSILLVSKVPLAEIRTVALDTSSMTSVALTKILFGRWWGGKAVFSPMQPDVDKMLASHDAGLVIGDPALQLDRSRWYTYDLAEEWIKLTGKAFVFAFWAMRKAALANVPAGIDLAAIFQESRDHGLSAANLQQIAAEWAPRLGLSKTDVESYLTRNIYYRLDTPCLEGLQLFYDLAFECKALPLQPTLSFLEADRRIAK